MRKTTAALTTAAAAVLATGVGLGTASASPAGPAAASGTEHFYLMSASTTSNRLSLIAAGVFTGAGVDISGNSSDTVQLPGGTFKINHSGNGPGGAPKVNPTTCFATDTIAAPFTVSGGTGKYKHIAGSGKAVITVVGILARTHGKCNFNANPVAQQETIIGTAKVHL
jgi:hypothetical protein